MKLYIIGYVLCYILNVYLFIIDWKKQFYYITLFDTLFFIFFSLLGPITLFIHLIGFLKFKFDDIVIWEKK